MTRAQSLKKRLLRKVLIRLYQFHPSLSVMSKSNVTSTDQSAVEKSDKGAKTDPLCHNDKGSENETL